MLRKGIRYLKKNKSYINTMLFVIATFYGIILFFTAFHNIDLLSNYSLMISDYNRENSCDNSFIDIREIQDCNGLMQCPDYKTIYIRSVNTLFVSFILFTTILMAVGFSFIKKEIEKKNAKR